MISRVNSINFKGAKEAQAQNNPTILTRAKAFSNDMIDKFVGVNGENKEKVLNAASFGALAGVIITAAGMLTKSKALKFIGLMGAFVSAATGIAANRRAQNEPLAKEIQEPAAIKTAATKEQDAAPIAQEAPQEQVQTQEEAIKAAEALAQENVKPTMAGTTQG